MNELIKKDDPERIQPKRFNHYIKDLRTTIENKYRLIENLSNEEVLKNYDYHLISV